MRWKNGDVYQGHWANDKREDPRGIYMYRHGRKFFSYSHHLIPHQLSTKVDTRTIAVMEKDA